MKTLVEIQNEVKVRAIEKAVESVRYRIWEKAQWQEITAITIVPTAEKDCIVVDKNLTIPIAKANGDHSCVDPSAVYEGLQALEFFKWCAFVRLTDGLVIYVPPFPTGIFVL